MDPYIRWAHAFQVLACLFIAYLVACGISALLEIFLNWRRRRQAAQRIAVPLQRSTHNF